MAGAIKAVLGTQVPLGVCVLGATGSIGASTLQVLARHPDRYRVVALSGHQRLEQLADLTVRHRPLMVAVPSGSVDAFAALLRDRNQPLPQLFEGEAGLCALAAAPESAIVMAAIVGAAGLKPALAAVQTGKRVLLANKEALVMAGPLFMQAVRAHGATLLPVDSEHNAIFQCLPADYFASTESLHHGSSRAGVRQILLTASGGPFRGWTLAQLSEVTPEQACKHPNWQMGRKISVDSATLINKGLELIEACHLFEVPPERVTVVVHPQSVIHSLVQYVDGSTLAQMGLPDMCTPIAHALAWPERIDSGVGNLDLMALARLDFEAPDEQVFGGLHLAREAMRAGGLMPAVFNAANEVAVEAFLQRRLDFVRIPVLIESTMARFAAGQVGGSVRVLADVLGADATARALAQAWLASGKAAR